MSETYEIMQKGFPALGPSPAKSNMLNRSVLVISGIIHAPFVFLLQLDYERRNISHYTITTSNRHVFDARYPFVIRPYGDAGIKAFQSIDRAIINPIFMLQFFLPVLLFASTYQYARNHGYQEATYLLIGGIAYILVIVLTVAVNVPLNDAIKKVDPSSSTEQLTEARAAFNEAKWSASNLLRTTLNLLGVICTAFALHIHR